MKVKAFGLIALSVLFWTGSAAPKGLGTTAPETAKAWQKTYQQACSSDKDCAPPETFCLKSGEGRRCLHKAPQSVRHPVGRFDVHSPGSH
jgi:hypothetical protein